MFVVHNMASKSGTKKSDQSLCTICICVFHFSQYSSDCCHVFFFYSFLLEERCCIFYRGLLLRIAGLALCKGVTVRLLRGVAVVNVEPVEGAAGLVSVECVVLGLQVPVEGLGGVGLAPVEVVGLIPVEGGVGLVPLEGGVGLF